MKENPKKQLQVTEFFLIIFAIFIIILVFSLTLMTINQAFIEKRNSQLENYKTSFKEVPKLLKVKIVFQSGSSTLVLPDSTSNNKLTTIFVNAPKGTKITFSAYPGAPADVYEKVSDTPKTLSKEKKIGGVYFESVNWTKNGVPITDEAANDIVVPKAVPVQVVSPEEFKVNVEQEIKTIDVALSTAIARDDQNTLTSQISIVTDTYDRNSRFVNSTEIIVDRNQFDQNIKTIIENHDTNKSDTNTIVISPVDLNLILPIDTNVPTDANIISDSNHVGTDLNTISTTCTSTSGVVCGAILPTSCSSTNTTCYSLAERRNFSNMCDLNAANAIFVNYGECKPCKNAGEYFPATSSLVAEYRCCSGLTAISATSADSNGTTSVSPIYKVCSNCGNGTCESWENSANCLTDCPVSTGTMISEQIKCVFSNSTTLIHKCYFDGNYACSGTAYCTVNVSGYSGKNFIWTSDCNGVKNTTIGGDSKIVSFDCSSSSSTSGTYSCGGTSGTLCPANYFCYREFNVNYSVGVCQIKPTGYKCGCTDVLSPVCGSDNVTYSNPCLARCTGANVISNAACTTSGTTVTSCSTCNSSEVNPVCGKNGVTYNSPCLASCNGTDTNFFGACITASTGSSYTSTYTLGSCTCALYYSPVCSSDGKTYLNTCFANCQNATFTSGAC